MVQSVWPMLFSVEGKVQRTLILIAGEAKRDEVHRTYRVAAG